MRRIIFVCFICLLFSACDRLADQSDLPRIPLQTQDIEASETPSVVVNTPTPQVTTYTPVPVPTLTPTPSLTPFLTPTQTPKPYLIRFEYGAGDGVDEISICMGSYTPYPQFILYEDGQLILDTSKGYMVTTLTGMEVQDLLKDIEKTGFFEVENINALPEKSGVYNLPPGIEYGDGGWGKAITVKGRQIWVNPELDQYLAKPIKDTIDIVQRFHPKEKLQPYIPDKLKIFVLGKKTGFFPETIPTSGLWPAELPPLDPSYGYNSYLISDKKIIQLAIQLKAFTTFPEMNVFTQDGADYFVVACPIMDPWW